MAHPDRPTAAARSRDRLVTALGLTAAFFVVEVLGALWTGSLALLADPGHMLTDVGGTTLTVFAGWTVGDPVASLAIALIIVPRTWGLVRQAVNVLLEGTPTHLDLGEIEAAILRVPGVRRVHDLHVWTLTSGREAMSAHVVVVDVGESDRLLRELHEVLHAWVGIDVTTI